jgi:hypothetical protein
MNREKAYRQAVYEILTGISIDLGYGSIPIPIYDNKLESDEDIYILLEAQTAQNESAFPLYVWRCTLELSIYHTQQNSATFDAVDMVCEIIEDRVTTSPGANNFGLQSGWQISNTYLQSSNSLKYQDYKESAGTVVQKIIQLSSQLIKL